MEHLAAVIAANPHCEQLSASAAQPFLEEALKTHALQNEDRFLTPAWPRMPYRQRPDSERSSCHWGQLKLFESELKCLTECGLVGSVQSHKHQRAQPIVLYVGAAPGRHLPSLIRRVPNCRFELYDPAEFDAGLLEFVNSAEGAERVSLFSDFFDEEKALAIAARRKKGPLIFICDVRTACSSTMDLTQVEECVQRDMTRQRLWVETLRPAMSLLKFRLPWGPGKTKYLRGRILVQTFPPCTSTETRLLVTPDVFCFGETIYDQEDYEQQLMHHNTIRRASLHKLCMREQTAKLVPGLDKCYDCAAFSATVRSYLAALRGISVKEVSSEDIATEINSIISEVSLSSRSLATAYHVSSLRHNGRQFNKICFTDPDGNDRYVPDSTFATTLPQAGRQLKRKIENSE